MNRPSDWPLHLKLIATVLYVALMVGAWWVIKTAVTALPMWGRYVWAVLVVVGAVSLVLVGRRRDKERERTSSSDL